MNFSKAPESFGQQQHAQALSPGTVDRQHLTALPPADRAAFYQHSLVQPTAIYILPDGTFSKLHGPLISSVHFTAPKSQGDTVVLEAAKVFYTQNEFAVAISTIPNFISWTVNNVFKPSDIITRLAILYGPPTNPGGGNNELRSLLSMPNLQSVRLLFQDYQWKGLGPYTWLRPSIGVIMALRTLPRLNLRLQLQRKSRGPEGNPEDIDAHDTDLEDIISYLQPPTVEEERAVSESRRIINQYLGPQSSHVHILMQSGWSAESSNWVVYTLSSKVCVKAWIEEERLDMLASLDVEML